MPISTTFSNTVVKQRCPNRPFHPHKRMPPTRVRSYELILLVFGAMAGLTWAMLALFVYSVAGDGLPSAVDFTVLLPLTAAFLLDTWLHPPIDVLSLLIGVWDSLRSSGSKRMHTAFPTPRRLIGRG
jgi:hypothetical protein